MSVIRGSIQWPGVSGQNLTPEIFYNTEDRAVLVAEPSAGEIRASCSPDPPESFYDTYVCEELSGFVGEQVTKGHCIGCDTYVDVTKSVHTKENCVLEKPLKCSLCSQRFNYEVNLKVHELLHDQSSFVSGSSCPICIPKGISKTFERPSAFVAHLKTHVKNDNIVCSKCDAEFEFQGLYNQHRRLVHGKDFERSGYSTQLGYCPECSNLIELSKIESHKLTHSMHRQIVKKKQRFKAHSEITKMAQEGEDSRRKHKCENCGKAFQRPAELRRHQVVHGGVPKLKCDKCGKEFAHDAGLKAHVKSFHGEERLRHKCKICGLLFAKPSNVDRHIEKNHPVNPSVPVFDCPNCPCQFTKIVSLQKHVATIHSNRNSAEELKKTIQRPTHQCNICETKFTKQSSLKRHAEKCTPAMAWKKPFRCTKCEKRFKLRSSLKLHTDTHQQHQILAGKSMELVVFSPSTSTVKKCPVCDKTLSSKSTLRKHMLIHQSNYKCPDCNQIFPTIHWLDRHRCFQPSATPFTLPASVVLDSNIPSTSTSQPITAPKRFSCKHCSNSFHTFKAYNEHNALHRGRRPFLCWTCHKSFRTSALLDLHKQIHNKEPIYCELCPEILTGRVQYIHHLKIHHRTATDEAGKLVPLAVGNDGDRNLVSAQSYPVNELNGKELAEVLFQNRAQSVDFEVQANNERQMNLETTIWQPLNQGTVATIQDRSMRCSVCFHLFDSLGYLLHHFSLNVADSDHAIAIIQCPLCLVSLRGSSDAIEHITSFHPYMTANNSPMKRMVPYFIPSTTTNTTSDVKKFYACSECPTQFSKKSDLVRHGRIHTGERPFACEVCERRFSVKSTLTAHAKIHSRGEPTECCSICGTKLFSKSALALHLRIHSGEKPLTCRFCDASFRTSATRKSHESSVHGVQQPHKCTKRGCRMCAAERKRRVNLLKDQDSLTIEEGALVPLSSEIIVPTYSSTSSTIPENISLIKESTSTRNALLFPVKIASAKKKTMMIDDSIRNTYAQIAGINANPLQATIGSAFEQSTKMAKKVVSSYFIYITAKRISGSEYSVVISRAPPKAIREGVDTTASLEINSVRSFGEENGILQMVLCDSQLLQINARGLLEQLGEAQTVTIRARPLDLANRCCAELSAPILADYCTRCHICNVNLPTRELSEAHFASEDHETAQVLHPLVDAVQLQDMHDSLMAPSAISQPRREELTDFTCKLCSRKFVDMEPLVAHIRRDHERDHPNTLAPRPAARTAPPLERRLNPDIPL